MPPYNCSACLVYGLRCYFIGVYVGSLTNQKSAPNPIGSVLQSVNP